jgi:hypothetical protein
MQRRIGTWVPPGKTKPGSAEASQSIIRRCFTAFDKATPKPGGEKSPHSKGAARRRLWSAVMQRRIGTITRPAKRNQAAQKHRNP